MGSNQEPQHKVKSLKAFEKSDKSIYTRCVICFKDGDVCHWCANKMLREIRAETGLTYRIKRNFEKVLESKIDEMANAHVGQSDIQSKKLELMEKVKAMKAKVEAKQKILSDAKTRVRAKRKTLEDYQVKFAEYITGMDPEIKQVNEDQDMQVVSLQK